MKLDSKKFFILIINCVLSILIILAPSIITGHQYNENLMGSLQVAELVLRTGSFIIGLLVIYDAIKTCFK